MENKFKLAVLANMATDREQPEAYISLTLDPRGSVLTICFNKIISEEKIASMLDLKFEYSEAALPSKRVINENNLVCVADGFLPPKAGWIFVSKDFSEIESRYNFLRHTFEVGFANGFTDLDSALEHFKNKQFRFSLKLADDIFEWGKLAFKNAEILKKSKCRLRIYRNKRQVTVIVSEVPDNEGRSITNGVESIITHGCKKYDIDFDRVIWLEHYPEEITSSNEKIDECFSRVHLQSNKNPYWENYSKEQAERLIGMSLND
ncbi:MAG: hypothetical protein QNJ38_01470 [Prochloraceae cyanobacterium]|nr:hypothetical protein [Prochloraceae cyanobacterium]